MRRTLRHRLIASLTALFASLSAPAIAVAHGHVHEHLAQAHAVAHEAGHGTDAHGEAGGHVTPHRPHGAPVRAPAREVQSDGGDAHNHGHPSLIAALAPRESGRAPVVALPTLAVPAVAVLELAGRLEVVTPSRSDRALLARPGPDGGPPPRLRAPPTR